jgi:hypothetical protein
MPPETPSPLSAKPFSDTAKRINFRAVRVVALVFFFPLSRSALLFLEKEAKAWFCFAEGASYVQNLDEAHIVHLLSIVLFFSRKEPKGDALRGCLKQRALNVSNLLFSTKSLKNEFRMPGGVLAPRNLFPIVCFSKEVKNPISMPYYNLGNSLNIVLC